MPIRKDKRKKEILENTIKVLTKVVAEIKEDNTY
jgi:hypothetical protein